MYTQLRRRRTLRYYLLLISLNSFDFLQSVSISTGSQWKAKQKTRTNMGSLFPCPRSVAWHFTTFGNCWLIGCFVLDGQYACEVSPENAVLTRWCWFSVYRISPPSRPGSESIIWCKVSMCWTTLPRFNLITWRFSHDNFWPYANHRASVPYIPFTHNFISPNRVMHSCCLVRILYSYNDTKTSQLYLFKLNTK